MAAVCSVPVCSVACRGDVNHDIPDSGHDTITATYGGDMNFTGSRFANLLQTVIKVASATTMSSSHNPSSFNQSVTFTATVTGTGSEPTGVVTFLDGSNNIGTGMLVNGLATISSFSLAIGSHSITAVYGGDSNFAGSTATWSQTVTQARE